MTKPLTKTDGYRGILADIESLYIRTQKAVVEMYWLIGRKIVEAEQNGAARAPYAGRLIVRLSRDLTARHGNGFSLTNLKDMRRFYLAHRKSQHVGQLPWSDHVALLAVKDPKKRQWLEQRVLKEDLSRDDIRALARQENIKAGVAGEIIDTDKPIPQLTLERGLLYTYQVIVPSTEKDSKGGQFVDYGFNNHKWIEGALSKFKNGDVVESIKDKSGAYSIKDSGRLKKDLYTFKAKVERVVDGDTLWVEIDCGFDSWRRQELRLRGIDCPEMDTEEGKRAKAFALSRLKDCEFIVIKTYKDDKYGRYLADIFYKTDEKDPLIVASEGVYLNQELLDNRLSVKYG